MFFFMAGVYQQPEQSNYLTESQTLIRKLHALPSKKKALPSQTVFDFLSQRTIDSAISFRTLWTIFGLAKTSNKPISLTTWLAVDPIFKPL